MCTVHGVVEIVGLVLPTRKEVYVVILLTEIVQRSLNMFEVKITEIRVVDCERQAEWVSMGKQIDGSEPRGWSPVIPGKKKSV